MTKKPWALAIVGATATGKTALSFHLAEHLDIEILCMDSMQIYRGMDIGTAKPTLQEQETIAHHLHSFVDPKEAFSVDAYVKMALDTIQAVHQRGHIPLFVGGTGLYLKALSEGLELGCVQANEEIREKYHAMALEENGKERLHAQLANVDPVTAKRLHPNDVRRVVRALEIFEVSGIPMSEQPKKKGNGLCDVFPIALDMPRPLLVERIERRVDIMMEQGLLDEVKRLMDQGVLSDAQSMQGIGYKELMPVLQGNLKREDGIAQIKRNTKLYAKKQNTWFRGDSLTQWFAHDEENLLSHVLHRCADFIDQRRSEE